MCYKRCPHENNEGECRRGDGKCIEDEYDEEQEYERITNLFEDRKADDEGAVCGL